MFLSTPRALLPGTVHGCVVQLMKLTSSFPWKPNLRLDSAVSGNPKKADLKVCLRFLFKLSSFAFVKSERENYQTSQTTIFFSR